MSMSVLRARWRLWGAVVVGILCLTTASSAQDTNDYVINDYQLTIDLSSGRTARVTMDLTYLIRSGTKSEGFKFIGTVQPAQVEGSDDDGRPIRVTVERQRETLIRWYFTPSGRGERRVQIRFTMPAELLGTGTPNVLQVPWAGVFKVPVRRSVYRVVAPPDWTGDVTGVSQLPVSETRVDGRRAFEVEQRPLRESAFGLRLSPGLLVAVSPSAAAARPATRGVRGFLDAVPPLFAVAVILLIIVAVLVSRAKRGGHRQTQSGSGSVSSCAGGSSCSSGCGGGGCGGGCGG